MLNLDPMTEHMMTKIQGSEYHSAMRKLIRVRPLLLLLVFSLVQGTLVGQTASSDEHDQKIQRVISTFHVGEKIVVRQYRQPKSSGVFVQTSVSELVYTETTTNTTRHIPVNQIRSVHEIRTGHKIGVAVYIGLVVAAGVGTAIALR